MKNQAPKLKNEQYENNFSELHLPLSRNSAVAEANRCLYCYDSPCTKSCPTHIDIPGFIKKISTGNFIGSAKTILNSNWIALTCAKACPVDVLCEGACVYNDKKEKAIEIGRLQRFVMENYFEQNMPRLFNIKEKNGNSVGVIGSGPAGLACAAELSLLGYEVIIYESKKIPGGLDSWGIAPYKMRQSDSLKEIKLVESLGAKILTEVTIGESTSFGEILRKYDAVFLGVGLGASPSLNIEGEDINGVVDAIEFIENVKKERWDSVKVGKRVAVIGAGNTAIDAATEAVRLGAEQVNVIYRRDARDMPAYKFEFDLAKHDGVNFYFQTLPVGIIGDGTVEGIECVRTKITRKNNSSNQEIVPVKNSEFVIPVDMVIKSIGQNPKTEFLSSVKDLKIEQGKISVNRKTYQTSNKKIFAGGDCINGGKEVVNAAYDGKQAAHGIDEFLSGR